MSLTISLAKARAHWRSRQLLGAATGQRLAEVVSRIGWLRTLGGVEVYLAVRARFPWFKRAELDAALAEGELRVVPAVRGCIYLVPRAEVPIALGFADAIWRRRTERELEKVGAKWSVVDKTAKALLEVVVKGPQSTDAFRRELPEKAVTSFGDAGKKIGLSTSLPLALRDLELRGQVERVTETGRLDTERYLWRVPSSPSTAPPGPEAVARSLCELFFNQAGPATAAHFAAWSGLTLGEARATINELELAPVEIEGFTRSAFALKDSIESDLFTLGPDPMPNESVHFLPFEDNFVTSHGGPAPLVDPAQHDRVVPSWGHSKPSTLGKAAHLALRPIVIGDSVGGFWEYDPDTKKIEVAFFEKPSKKRLEFVASESERLARFMAEELGHGRSFSLDTDDALRKRVAALRDSIKR